MPKKVMKIEMDPTELFIRMVEAFAGVERLPGQSADDMVGQIIAAHPETAVHLKTMADIAYEYFAEVLKKHGTLHQVN